ncbi:MAG: SBBP repeat-containing protein [Chloroflexi bacterium]|nr:SBBP repeat-containing protein [Chloroflexota bacterium]
MNRRPIHPSRPSPLARGLLTILLLLSAISTSARYPEKTTSGISPQLSTSAPLFIENSGQFPREARFLVWGGPEVMWLAEDNIWLTLSNQEVSEERDDAQNGRRRARPDSEPQDLLPRSPALAPRNAHVRLSFTNANPHPRLQPLGRAQTRFSYFYGSDPAGWYADVPVWSGVRYVDLYPSVDLEIGGDDRDWFWQLAAQTPQTGLDQIRLRVEGAQSADVSDGRLRLTTAAGELILPLPTLAGNAARSLPSVTRIGDSAFEITSPFTFPSPVAAPQSPPAHRQTANADPLYSTLLGGDNSDVGFAIAVDESGHAYVTGPTLTPDFPTTPGAFDTTLAGQDVFVAKVNPMGSGLVYATFLGGSGNEWSYGVAVDGEGHAFVGGETTSADFPTTLGAHDSELAGASDTFIAKLDPQGAGLLYSTLLGGSGADGCRGLALDVTGSVYVTGITGSSDFPITPGAFSGNRNDADIFVAKLNPSGNNLDYATYVGGYGMDQGESIAVDGSGMAYVLGVTRSFDFPTTPGSFDPEYNGSVDYVIFKLNGNGSALMYSAFLGGSESDGWLDPRLDPRYYSAIAVDSAGRAYATGHTSSPDFPATPGALDTTCGTDGDCNFNGSYSYRDAFVVKVTPDGSALEYATFLGGHAPDMGYAIAVDGAGSAYITGYTSSSTFPITPDALDDNESGLWDGFVAVLRSDGAHLFYSTFLGGEKLEQGWGIALDSAGNIYATGFTNSADFPTTAGAFDTSYDRYEDVFVVKLAARSTYAISGRVRDYWGDNLAGIAVAAGGSAGVTDADGVYTVQAAAGEQTVAPVSTAYFWQPVSRTVYGPPALVNQNFLGYAPRKSAQQPSDQPVAYGQRIDYTIEFNVPESRAWAFSDAIPDHTVYITRSLSAPTSIVYDPVANAISGTLEMGKQEWLYVRYAVQVVVTGTVEAGPLIRNQACIRYGDDPLSDCKWSNTTTHYTYLWPVYLPQVAK